MSNKLKEQLEKKKKEAQELALSNPNKKYKTRGEIEKEALKKKEEEKLKIEQEKKEKQEAEEAEKKLKEKTNKQNNSDNTDKDNENGQKDKLDNNGDGSSEPVPFLPKEQVIRKLRARGQPITYFGETDYMRAERLRLLEENEPIEYTQGDNEFQNLLKQIHSEQNQKGDAEETNRKKRKEPEESEEELKEEAGKSKYGNIYYFLWKLLKDWQEHLDSRPEEEVRTPQGSKAMAIYAQCKIHIKPLFEQLKSKSLPEDLLQHIFKIVEFCKEREYSKANSQYMEMSIGNAPWPMGVTMVGIHERSSREKISSHQVAHVLNDETQRKYIQGIKRLMTFCQTKYPNNPSKCVG